MQRSCCFAVITESTNFMPLVSNRKKKRAGGIRKTNKSLAKIIYTRCSFPRLDLVSLAHPIPHACLYHWILKLVTHFFLTPKNFVFKIKRTSDGNFSVCVSLRVSCLSLIALFCCFGCRLFASGALTTGGAFLGWLEGALKEQCLQGAGRCQPHKPQQEDNEFRHFRSQPASENGTQMCSCLFLKYESLRLTH